MLQLLSLIMPETEKPKLSRREYLKVKLAVLAGLVIATAGLARIKIGITEAVLSQEVKEDELGKLRKYFSDTAAEIESSVKAEYTNIPQELEVELGGFSADIKLLENSSRETLPSVGMTFQVSGFHDLIESGLLTLPNRTELEMDNDGNVFFITTVDVDNPKNQLRRLDEFANITDFMRIVRQVLPIEQVLKM